jgi:uncharacterized OB-fold protein
VSNGALGPERAYFAALQRGEFLIQKCRACDKHIFYPRIVCPHCGSDGLDWLKPSGRGTVYSTTTVRRGGEAGPDLNIALIDLEEGVRLMSRVEGVAAPDVRIGMKVVASIATTASGPLLVFNPAAGASDE